MNRNPNDEESIFASAIEIDSPAEREAYVKSVCGENPRLHDRLQALLKSHDEESEFLKPPQRTESDAPIEKPGTVVGPYKLLQQIGEGGFGVVYMAEQQQPVRRKVAFKIIKPGMDTKQVIARFEAERQALALMDHPNIAKVLDAGSTNSGRPYFVMELVKGVPVTEYCDKNNLSTPERLKVFVQICRAVQHAHQKGVIHRDIKPANVMVTLHDGHPVPKVIDFGVSKAISQQLTEKTLFTAYGQMIGTPQYMSPEQAEMSGLDVDTRSDIYSLGVLLYELLTGTTPIDKQRLHTLAYLEMQRVIREEDPPRPSARLSTLGGELTILAKHQSTDPKRLMQLLRGDLDWIVMKALAKERVRRYESASEFADDIERHLSDETIQAHPPSTAYQVSRFIRRHKGPASAAAALFTVLLLGIAGTTIGLISATRARRLAEIEAQRAGIAEAAERDAAADARRAEGEARKNLKTSEQLRGELSTAVAKLSEGASRLANQRAYTLIEQGRPQLALHWLGRALELAPEGELKAGKEIRTAMSAVASRLPRSRFVLGPGDDRVFGHAELNADGTRMLLLVETDPPAARETLELRVIDTASGDLVSSIDVPKATHWAAFGGDGKTVFSSNGAQLLTWDVETAAKSGAAYDLPLPDQLPIFSNKRFLEMPEETRIRFESFVRSRFTRIRAISPNGQRVVIQSGRGGFAATEGRLNGSRLGRGGQTGVGRRNVFPFTLLNLESGVVSELPAHPNLRPTFIDDGRRIVFGSAVSRSELQLRRWDVAANALDEEWKVDFDGRVAQWCIDHAGRRAVVGTAPAFQRGRGDLEASLANRRLVTTFTFRLVDLNKGEFLSPKLEIKGSLGDLAISPSGNWAAILTSPAGEEPQVTVWDLQHGESYLVPIPFQSRNRFGAVARAIQSFGETSGYRISIAGDDQTLLVWDHDKLVGWQLAAHKNNEAGMNTAQRVQQIQFVSGNQELITVAGPQNESRSTFGALTPFEIQRWSVGQRTPIGNAVPIQSTHVVVSPNGRTMVAASGNSIQRWDLTTMSKIGPALSYGGTMRRLEFVANGRRLAAHTVWSRERGSTVRITYNRIGAGFPNDEDQLITAIVPDSAADRAGLQVGDVMLRVGDESVTSIARFKQLVDSDFKESIPFVVLRDGVERTIRFQPEPGTAESISEEIQASAHGMVRLWDMESGLEVGQLPVPFEGEAGNQRIGDRFRWAAVAPDGETIVTASRFDQRTELRLFSAESGRPIAPSVEYARQIIWLGYGPTGDVLATLDSGSVLQLWNASDLTPLGPPLRPTGTVNAVVFAPDGDALLLSMLTAAGPRLSLWNTRTAHRLSLEVPIPEVAGLLEVSSDGASVAATGRDGNVWVVPLPKGWDDEPERCRQTIEALTGGSLTEQGDPQWFDVRQWSDRLAALPPAPKHVVSQETRWDAPLAGPLPPQMPGEVAGQQLAALDESIADQPGNWLVRLRRATLLARLARWDEASQELETALQQADRSLTVSWLKRQLVAGSRFRARPILSRAITDRIDQLSREALWYCERLLAIAPDDPTGRLMCVNLLLRVDRFDEAEVALNAVIRGHLRQLMLENLCAEAVAETRVLWQRSQRLRIRSGRAIGRLREMGVDAEATLAAQAKRIQWLLDRIIDEQPEAWEPLMARAELLAHAQRMDEAFADLARARQFAPAEAFSSRVNRLASLIASTEVGANATDFERISSAIPIWERVLEFDPENTSTLGRLANYHARLADWERAAELHERLAVATPDDFVPQYYLATILLKLDRLDEYREQCHRLLAEFGASADLLLQRRAIQSCLLHETGSQNHDQLLAQIQGILDEVPIVLHWRLTTLGLAHLRSGNASEAKVSLEKVLELDSASPSSQVRALATLVLVYLAESDEAKARETLQRATERYAEVAPEAGRTDLGSSSWHGWLICDVLLTEAKTRLKALEE